MTLTVVLGPRTRLAAALLPRLAPADPVLLVARDERDVAPLEELAAGLAGGRIEIVLPSRLRERAAALVAGHDLRVVVAAMGPAHPTDPGVVPDLEADAAAVRRDLALLDDLLAVGAPAHVVLVSTILALAPAADRRYYGGWKSVVEQSVRNRVEARAEQGAGLTVLYPGRIRADRGRPWQRVHVSYDRLARVVAAATPGKGAEQTVGADSRIWLIFRSISFALRSLKVHRAAEAPPR